MRENRFPKGWNEDRVREVLRHYEQQTEEEAVAEDEATFEAPGQAVMVVPHTLVPTITKLIEKKRRLLSPRKGRPNTAALQPTSRRRSASKGRRSRKAARG